MSFMLLPREPTPSDQQFVYPNPPVRGPDYSVPNKGPHMKHTASILLSIAGVVVIARMYSRIFVLRFVGGDDYCILGAMVTAIMLTVMLNKCVGLGAGMHIWDIPGNNIFPIIKLGYGMQILYIVVMAFTKASLLLLLMRLVKNRPMSIFVWSIFGFMVAFATASFWATVFHCTPPSYAWNRWDQTEKHHGTCGNIKALQYWVPSGNIIMDVILWLLPLRLIQPLKLPRLQKAELYVVFILGAMVFISASVRISLILKLGAIGQGSDPTWTTSQISLWSIVEATIAIICSSLGTVRPLFNRHFPYLFDVLSKAVEERKIIRHQNPVRISIPTPEGTGRTPSKEALPLPSMSDPELARGIRPESATSPENINLESYKEGDGGGRDLRGITLEMDITDTPHDPESEYPGPSGRLSLDPHLSLV